MTKNKLLLKEKIGAKNIVIYYKNIDSRQYNFYYLARFIFNKLKLIKNDLPHYTKIIICDLYELDDFGNCFFSTSIKKLKTIKKFKKRVSICFNISEILGYYQDKIAFDRLYNLGFKEKISLKYFIQFVLYHELGHYANRDIYRFLGGTNQNTADEYSFNILNKFYGNQLYFKFYNDIKIKCIV